MENNVHDNMSYNIGFIDGLNFTITKELEELLQTIEESFISKRDDVMPLRASVERIRDLLEKQKESLIELKKPLH